jgi:RNA 2',3'-cyclic 3'-phosphodiesterase
VRCFVAVYPDEDARGELADVAPDDADDVRVTDMAEWHVTIRFLGEVDEAEVGAVGDAAAAAFSRIAPCTVRLGPTTALGTGARVLFVPAEGVDHLASALDDALDDLVEPRDPPFRGHLTLARARGRGRLPGSLSGRPVTLRFPVTEAALVVSRLDPERAVHQVVRWLPLREG